MFTICKNICIYVCIKDSDFLFFEGFTIKKKSECLSVSLYAGCVCGCPKKPGQVC